MVMSSSLENLFSLVSNELSVWKGNGIFEVLNWLIKQTKKDVLFIFLNNVRCHFPQWIKPP